VSVVPEITLVPYTEVEHPRELAGKLHVLANSVRRQLAAEMPYVLERNVNAGVGLRSVNGVRQAMKDDPTFAAFVVVCNGVKIGVATYSQQRLSGKRRWLGLQEGPELANGPLIAGWLGNIDRPKGLLPHVLRAFATIMAANPKLTGKPWTIVRVGHPYVRRCLDDPNNGFGGFEEIGAASDYGRVDGVKTLRLLMVGHHTMESLRG